MTGDAEKIIVTISGESVKDSRVPVNLFTRTISGIQTTIYYIGKSIIGVAPRKRGRLTEPVAQELQLYLLKTEPGSLVATLELPKVQEDLFPDRKNINRVILTKYRNIISAFQERDVSSIEREIEDPLYRDKIIREINQIASARGDDYQVQIAVGRQARAFSIEKVRKDESPLLYSAIFKTGVELEHGSELLIRALCRASQEKEGMPKISRMLDYDIEETIVELVSIRQFTYGGHLYILKNELDLVIRHEDNIFTIEYHHLDILAYGESRDEALDMFKGELAYIWHEYALEKDTNLLDHARSLKMRIRNLISGVEPIERAKNG